MTTKKVVKMALKSVLGAEKMTCAKCRDDLRILLLDISKGMRDGIDKNFPSKIQKGHFVYVTPVEDHKVPEPVQEEEEAVTVEDN